MKKRSTPEFWARPGLAQAVLEPLAWANAAAGAARRALATPWRASVPVLCVGNAVAGGAGKTPVSLSLAQRLSARGARPFLLSRGYGGTEPGPLRVDAARHDANAVGDEALLLAAAAPTIIARDRVAGARAAIAAGAGIIVMDDGFQNPSLVKDCALLVVDGAYGFGNGSVIPAGPLRESAAGALARADAVVLIGADEAGVAPRLAGTRVLAAELAVTSALPTGPLVAFAGIGRPQKFFRTIEAAGGSIATRHEFPDHHPYDEAELQHLADVAQKLGARLITTAKDAARLGAPWRARIDVLEIEVRWRDEAALDALLAPLLTRAHG
ncbi:MAG TPA: tetraacyldisaccharide 4'-kinase [Stellaceae bacterium]|nr:tetraacyldisaccharide 4'-kinase [Stellaceae bacterium]